MIIQMLALTISKVEQGVQTFDTKDKHVFDATGAKQATTSSCCPNGWRLTFAGSRFKTPTVKQYPPTEGEALAVAWSLNSAKMFVLACQDLIVTGSQTFAINI